MHGNVNRTYLQAVQDAPLLLRRALRTIYNLEMPILVALRLVLLLGSAVVYVVSPFDLLPESGFGVIGFLDDAFFTIFLAVITANAYRQFVLERAVGQAARG